MPLPSIFQDHSFKRLVQGAAVGAVATMIIGFNWGGWSLESTAEKRADEASRSAVVAVLAPICVDKFQHAANATDNLIELKKVSSYMQGSFVEKGGWATFHKKGTPLTGPYLCNRASLSIPTSARHAEGTRHFLQLIVKCSRRCPLWSASRTQLRHRARSEKCQQQTYTPWQIADLTRELAPVVVASASIFLLAICRF